MYQYAYHSVQVANLSILVADFTGLQYKFILSQRAAVHLTKVLWREMEINQRTMAEKTKAIKRLSPLHYRYFADTDVCFCCFITETRLFLSNYAATDICFTYGCPLYKQYHRSCFAMGYSSATITGKIKEAIENLDIKKCR